MAGAERDVVPTRSVLLELKDEARFTREGHEFLDQKRMLVAAEMLRWLARYETTRERHSQVFAAARVALAEAVALHGIEELATHPPGAVSLSGVAFRTESFLGTPVRIAEGAPSFVAAAGKPKNPSPEARRCRERFADLLELELELGVIGANVLRLLDDYRRTERRARALENVILPELKHTIVHIDEQLEEQDFEEAERLRSRREPI